MYSRVTLLEVDTLRCGVEDALALFREQVLPALREQEAYAGSLVLSTPEGRGMIITFWETEEAARAVAFHSETIERYVTIFRSPPGREDYRVAVADFPAGLPA